MLVEETVSTKAFLIWEALRKTVAYNGLSSSTTLLANSLA